ncbi:Cu-oxidase-domain-containing protein [Marasmius fiardii PR-910]|nr:Cu-oxidase-domain-containing protein [Marasmius fiardii PR-910]
MKNFLQLLSAVLPATLVSAATVSTTLTVSNRNLAPDGFTRSTVVANGQYPAPPILVNKGDRLQITVNNRLTDPTMRRSTSLNLDGVFIQPSINYQEGQSFVAQCPIAPQNSFVHDVQLDPRQAGTFWYHSQLSVQYVDGFRGPLIIYDPQDPQKHLYDVDDVNTIIQLGDWWHNSSVDSLAFFAANDIIPVADTGTFNGVGRFNGGPALPFAVVNVVQHRRYRLRIINESARSAYNFSIDNHDFSIIETDGVNTNPISGNQVQILAGQRYSVVVNANQPVGNYWINAPFTGGSPARNPNQNATLSRGILRYAGAARRDPTAPMTAGPTNLRFVTEAQISPLVRNPPPKPDITLIFNVLFTPGLNGTGWRINNISYQPDRHNPTLVKVLQEGATNDEDFNISEHTIVLPQNKTVEVVFPSNDDDELHPFHMHGMNLWVVKPDSGTVNNTVNPIIRDTTGSGAAGTIVRFRTDRVGAWIYHCHIMWHMAAGLGSVMLVDPNATRATVRPNLQWDQLCPTYNALPEDEQ